MNCQGVQWAVDTLSYKTDVKSLLLFQACMRGCSLDLHRDLYDALGDQTACSNVIVEDVVFHDECCGGNHLRRTQAGTVACMQCAQVKSMRHNEFFDWELLKSGTIVKKYKYCAPGHYNKFLCCISGQYAIYNKKHWNYVTTQVRSRCIRTEVELKKFLRFHGWYKYYMQAKTILYSVWRDKKYVAPLKLEWMEFLNKEYGRYHTQFRQWKHIAARTKRADKRRKPNLLFTTYKIIENEPRMCELARWCVSQLASDTLKRNNAVWESFEKYSSWRPGPYLPR